MNEKLFIGLGNPGKKFNRTRHNLGIDILKNWVQHSQARATSSTVWKDSRYHAQICHLTFDHNKVTCLFPTTYMNNSGLAASAYLRRNFRWLWSKPDMEGVLIIHDELDLPLGSVKTKTGGSARGHNGVKSVHQTLGRQDIPRLLLGIDPAAGKQSINSVSDFVLAKFTPAEQEIIQQKTLPAAFEILNKISRS